MNRFTLQLYEPKRWRVTDSDTNVVLEFEQYDYNGSQRVDAPNGMDARTLVKVLKEMGEWIATNYYILAFPFSNDAQNVVWAKRIKALREQRGLTTYALAKASGVNRQTIEAIEQGNGCRVCTLEQLLLGMGFFLTIEEK